MQFSLAQVGQKLRQYLPAGVRHHDNMGKRLGAVVDFQMHRRQRVLRDDRRTGVPEVNGVGQWIGSCCRELREMRAHLVQQIGGVLQHQLRIFDLPGSGGCGREIVELGTEDCMRQLYVVRSIEESGSIRFVPISDARTLTEIGRKGLRFVPNRLREKRCRKVIVNPLGEVRNAND